MKNDELRILSEEIDEKICSYLTEEEADAIYMLKLNIVYLNNEKAKLIQDEISFSRDKDEIIRKRFNKKMVKYLLLSTSITTAFTVGVASITSSKVLLSILLASNTATILLVNKLVKGFREITYEEYEEELERFSDRIDLIDEETKKLTMELLNKVNEIMHMEDDKSFQSNEIINNNFITIEEGKKSNLVRVRKKQ